MADVIGREAAKPNPLLQALSPFVGTWNTVGKHPLVPGATFHGRTSFAWIEGGTFLMMRTEIDEPGIPSGISIFGADDQTGECSMLYFDERGVSRHYDVSLRARLRLVAECTGSVAAIHRYTFRRREHDRGTRGNVARRRRLGAGPGADLHAIDIATRENASFRESS